MENDEPKYIVTVQGKHEGTVSLLVDDDRCEEIVEAFARALVALTFLPETVRDSFITIAEDIDPDEYE